MWHLQTTQDTKNVDRHQHASTDTNKHQQEPQTASVSDSWCPLVSLSVQFCLVLIGDILGRSVGLLEDIWVFFVDVWDFQMCLGVIRVLRPCIMKHKHCSEGALKQKIFSPAVSETSKYHKISKCPDISFLKLPELCQIYAFLCPSEENHKTQSVGSPCSLMYNGYSDHGDHLHDLTRWGCIMFNGEDFGKMAMTSF